MNCSRSGLYLSAAPYDGPTTFTTVVPLEDMQWHGFPRGRSFLHSIASFEKNLRDRLLAGLRIGLTD